MNITENKPLSLSPQKKPLKWILLLGATGILSLLAVGGVLFFSRYNTANNMTVALKEFSKSEYPENPADLSSRYRQYAERKLTIVKKDATHFDIVLTPTNPHTAKIVFKNVDVSLFVPKNPEWVKQNKNLETIALVDREWNRQQVSFKPESSNIEVLGGDGFEKNNLVSLDLANNCLNAGLWEVLLFVKEGDSKKLYYQGWFTFPMGHYKNLFENNNKVSYWNDWYKLEHWQNPAGTPVDLQALRKVSSEKEIPTKFLADEKFITSGEQKRKFKLVFGDNLLTWKDLQNSDAKFATFVPPGRYDVNKPWGNEFWRIANFEKAILRDIKSPASNETLQELELTFNDKKTNQKNRFIVSGLNLDKIPQLPVSDYSKGLYMPMGIGVPPFNQSYEDLNKIPPFKSPYFSVLLDYQNKWINHHDTAIDGVVMHRDQDNPKLLHFYLLTYERHSVLGHYIITLN
ncbi:hypothetical protein G7B40_015645 [Aetokthonos hydrillicola Thurmond2011]|jgi:hypothetical protein|uniref:Uncharacterized protein n=1 Tax=Aetokthonos hydrillicola Thurmond2011 TaxID=2712845 RepID=A0AAP5M5J8_9CYAN|nr:hypothetical protein [Aetokthonos hydrillicola]MDR9895986.1 hypothetical protein [Aetokthonos hydrillicola Thurmond2011]